MVKSELVKRSPLRVFEKSIHGGLEKGQIGVVASKKGVGKTACLVHIATDKLFNEKHVIHVSFSAKVDNIVSWYEDIFTEISKKRDLENAVEVHDEIIRNRVIINFNQQAVTTGQIVRSVSAMISDGQFAADVIVFDGYDFSWSSKEDLDELKQFAQEKGLKLWFSASLKGKCPVYDETGFPQDLLEVKEYLDVVISLKYEGEYVHLRIVKDRADENLHEMQLQLDPKTMLIAES